MTAIDTLKALGFKESDPVVFQEFSDALGMSKEGEPHVVQAYLTKGDVTAIVEKNISPDNAGGVETITKHPAVLILESSKGRVCIPNQDDNAGLIAEMAEDLA